MRKFRLTGLLTALMMLPAIAGAQNYKIASISPTDYSKNTSYEVTLGGGAKVFAPVLTFGCSGVSRNPNCADNIVL